MASRARQVHSFRSSGTRLSLPAHFPSSHALCPHPELAQRGYRSFRVGRYVAIYSFTDDCLKILHVFHQSQDYVDDALG
ncbi:MAG: type II toxin-antitoxin system RelE/ParE family toxin [Collinsella sp.]